MAKSQAKHLGGMIVRGPMATDHYTQIHNLALRGAINTRYVGIFGFIASHEEGWQLTVASIAKALKVGRDFVLSALADLEAAHCLIRERERDEKGQLRGTVWFVTDLPFQLRQLGITDEETIRAAVRQAYERTQAVSCGNSLEDECLPRSEPKSDFPTQAVSCGNSLEDECLPRSEPKSDFPTHKKNKKKNKEKNSSSSSYSSSSSRPAAEATQEEEEEERKPTTTSSRPDAGLRDQAAQLLDAAQWPLGGRPSPVDHGRLVEWVARCLQAGHSDAAVTHELREAMSAQRPVGAAITRLRTLAGMPPQRTDTHRASNPSSTPTTQWEWELPPCEHEIPGGNMPIAPGVLRCPMCRRQAARGGADRIATQERDDELAATDAPRPRPPKHASARAKKATPPRTEREELTEEEFEERRRAALAALEALMTQETMTANPPRPVAAVEAMNSDTLTDTTPDASSGLLEALSADSGACVACGGTDQVATRVEGLVVPTPVCDPCWVGGVGDVA